MSQADLDRRALDHWPTCPSCENLCPPMARHCAECGSSLLIDGPTASVLHSRAMQAEAERRQA